MADKFAAIFHRGEFSMLVGRLKTFDTQASKSPEDRDPEEGEGQHWRARMGQKASLAKMRTKSSYYQAKSWFQKAGHQLMEWLTVAIIWLKSLWSQIAVLSVRFWESAKSPFVKKLD